MKFYKVRSEAYFSPSEIFVNDRDCRAEVELYPTEGECIGLPEASRDEKQPSLSDKALWKS